MNRLLRAAGLAVVAVLMILLLYVGIQVARPPRGAVGGYLRQLRRGEAPQGRRVVVLLGDSLTRGRVSADWVAELKRRLPAGRYRLVNAGVNGELAFQTLQRVERIIRCRPQVVIVLIGTEDANAGLSEAGRRRTARRLHLPQLPSAQWFQASLDALVQRLQAATGARIALMSIPPIGEDLQGPGTAQAGRYAAIIRRVADRRGAAYLPLFERMRAFLETHPGQPLYSYRQRPYLMYRALLERFLLGESFTAISRRNGFQLLTDFLHINERAAAMAAQLAAAYLLDLPPEPGP